MSRCRFRGFQGTYKALAGAGWYAHSQSPSQRLLEPPVRYDQTPDERLGVVRAVYRPGGRGRVPGEPAGLHPWRWGRRVRARAWVGRSKATPCPPTLAPYAGGPPSIFPLFPIFLGAIHASYRFR
jgi:hypothetical protein